MIEDIKARFKAMPKQSRNNIVVMILLVIMFIVGIIVRWDYISKELIGVKDTYVEVFSPTDSTKN